MSKLDELNQALEHTRKLLTMQTRNLQKLEEQAAGYGVHPPLALSNEIDQLKDKISQLQIELASLEADKEVEEAPLVYLHCFGRLEDTLPDHARVIDWSAEFNREVTPRKIPGPEIWEQTLWPELKALRHDPQIVPGLIRLRGTAALSAGFAFGVIFSRLQYQLEVAQKPSVWYSNDAPDDTHLEFVITEIEGEAKDGAAAVVINALTGQSSDDLVAGVKSYLAPRGGAQRILLLEAAPAVHDKESLTGAEAAVLARTSQPILRNFANRTKAGQLHLYLATPVGLAVFLGHNWNAIGTTVQCYEWSGQAGHYLPSCAVALN